jgi:uncharacterized protein (TIGR03086 family)
MVVGDHVDRADGSVSSALDDADRSNARAIIPKRWVGILVDRPAECHDVDVTASWEPVELLVVASEAFARRLRRVGRNDWRRPTPCSEWDVRALVNHVVGANVRYQLLLHGAPTEQVEATRTLNHLGDDALGSFVATADEVVACIHQDGALERIAHHASGDRTGRELLSMRILDAAIHGWNLARAIGADETLDNNVVAFLLAYTAGLDLGPQQHAFAPADTDVPRSASPQDQVLHRLGRQPNVTEEVQ